MDIIITTRGRWEIPSWPYVKVVIVGDQIEIADLQCDGPETENVVVHADLHARLVERDPKFSESSEYTSGWLTRAGSDATLSLAADAETIEAKAALIDAALRVWGEANSVTTLTITDSCRNSGAKQSTTDDESDADYWDRVLTTERDQ